MTTKQPIQNANHLYNPQKLFANQLLLTNSIKYLGLPLLITGFFHITSINNNSFIQIMLTTALFTIPWITYQLWRDSRNTALPIFSLISGLHWLYFSAALFWGDRRAPVWYSNIALVSEEAVTSTLLMVVLGVCSIWLGMHVRLTKRTSFQQTETLPHAYGMWGYIRFLLVAGLFVSFFPSEIYILGEGGRQWILALQTTVPLFAFLLLLRRYFRGEAAQLDKVLVVVFIVGRALTGLGSGWSGSVFYLGVAIGLVYLLERRTVPIRAVLLLIATVVFLQQGTGEVRAAFWYSENSQADLITRITFWLDRSIQSWQEAFSDSSGEQFTDNLRTSMLRVSLLTHAANVYDKTPALVPYQGSQLYEFAMIGLVPRFLWPDKPSGNDANQFYQVAYGVSREDFLDNVSIAIGFMIEAYISFGWVGVFAIMFLLGMFYRAVERIFFRNPTTIFAPSIGLLAMTMLLRIEAQLGLYLVGTIQAIVVAYLVLIPITFINTQIKTKKNVS